MKRIPRAWVIPACALLATMSMAADWPHLRGPGHDGRIPAPGTFEGESIGLEPAWKVPLGSSYSGVAVADGLVVTMFTDGDTDWVIAFEAKRGKEKWRHKIAGATRGHDGSHDGPLSTPVLGGGRAYVLGAAGELLALRLGDGERVWKKNLAADFGAEAPFFGFTTTPLLAGNTLVVQAGAGDGRAIVAFDARTGEKRWTRGDGKVDYQSPVLMQLGGRQQIVAASKTTITGLAPEDGDVLWVHELGENDRGSSTNPTFIGEDRFLAFMSGGATVYRVGRAEGSFQLEELYRTDALGRNYAPPVYHDGHLYGFRGQVLTCARADNGQRVWRSREPGGDGLILVDGHLVIFGARGNVVVAEASPEGYRERARLQAFEGSSLTWPSFADDRIFVRNYDTLAAVGVTREAKVAAKAASAEADHEFGRWLRQVRASSDRKAKVDELFARHPSLPIVEGDHVHFLYRGDAMDVGIAGSMVDTGGAEPMNRLERTDLFYRTYRLEPGARWEYRFQVDFEDWITDPRNPLDVAAVEGDGHLSELIGAGYRISSALVEPQGARGRLDSFTLTSKILGYDKNVKVWLPAGYDEGQASYPLLIVNDGFAWLERGRIAAALDNLAGSEIAAPVVAFVESHDQWWLEAGGSRTGEYVDMQVKELLPALAERYRLAANAKSRAVLGNRFYAFSAAWAALVHPDVFGGAALLSVSTGLGTGDELKALIGESDPAGTKLYLDWNRYDERNIDRGWDLAKDSRTLAERFRESGFRLHGGEMLDSHGWGGWSNRLEPALKLLYPPSGSGS